MSDVHSCHAECPCQPKPPPKDLCAEDLFVTAVKVGDRLSVVVYCDDPGREDPCLLTPKEAIEVAEALVEHANYVHEQEPSVTDRDSCPPEAVLESLQVGAVGRPPAHYSTTSGMQPFDVIDAFKLDFYEASVLKYLVRWRQKGGVNDLRKAQHYLEEIIEREGGGCHR